LTLLARTLSSKQMQKEATTSRGRGKLSKRDNMLKDKEITMA
jgi:hypothetical protein